MKPAIQQHCILHTEADKTRGSLLEILLCHSGLCLSYLQVLTCQAKHWDVSVFIHSVPGRLFRKWCAYLMQYWLWPSNFTKIPSVCQNHLVLVHDQSTLQHNLAAVNKKVTRWNLRICKMLMNQVIPAIPSLLKCWASDGQTCRFHIY